MKTRLRLIVLIALFTWHCASLSSLQKAQLSHDSLALVTDVESTLCYGKPLLDAMRDPAIAAAPNHCPSPQAAGIGLTDVKHQEFSRLMHAAVLAHEALTRLLTQGVSGPDQLVTLQNAVASLVAFVQTLAPGNPTVQLMATYLGQATARLK